ncbi:hypothetical protein Tco_1303360 [Tanacetum coccineum]
MGSKLLNSCEPVRPADTNAVSKACPCAYLFAVGSLPGSRIFCSIQTIRLRLNFVGLTYLYICAVPWRGSTTKVVFAAMHPTVLNAANRHSEKWKIGLCMVFVVLLLLISPGVYFADNVCPLGMDFLTKEVVLDVQNSSVRLPSANGMGGLPSFESGFGKGQVVLDFENSAVSMPSAERDIRKLAVFNDGSWLGLNVVLICMGDSEDDLKANNSDEQGVLLPVGRDYRAQFQLGNGELVAANYIQVEKYSGLVSNISLVLVMVLDATQIKWSIDKPTIAFGHKSEKESEVQLSTLYIPNVCMDLS